MKIIFISIIIVLSLISSSEAQWKQTGGPNGGSVTAFAANETTMFAGARSALYRSTNNGRNWNRLNKDEFTSSSIRKIILIGKAVLVERGSSLYRSTDNGDTWVKPEGPVVVSLAVVGSDIYVATPTGLQRSIDEGETWQGIYTLKEEIKILTVRNSTLFALTSNIDLIYRTSDNAETWSKSKEYLGFKEFNSLATTNVALFAGTKDSGIWKSMDNGTSWIQVNTGLTDKNVLWLKTIENTLYTATNDNSLFRSTDNGDTWSPIKVGLSKRLVYVITSNGTKLYCGIHGEGVFESDDNGKKWTLIGVPNQWVSALAANGSTIFAGIHHPSGLSSGVYRSTDNGEIWKAMVFPDLDVNMITMNSTAIFAYCSQNIRYKSTDNGESWALIPADLSVGSIYPLSMDGTVLLSAKKDGGMVRSTDNGNTWVTTVNPSDFTPTSFAGNGTIVYARSVLGLHRSNDIGLTWNLLPSTKTSLASTTSLMAKGNYVFAVRDDKGVSRSTDNGETWTFANSGLPDSSLYNITSITSIGTTLYVGEYSKGVYRSLDNGNTWTAVNDGLANLGIQALAVSGTTLYAGTGIASVWKIDVNLLDARESINGETKTPQLFCYPNPATNILTIDRTSLQFPENTFVHYTLSTLVCGKVMEFDNSEPKFTIPLDGMASGVYSLTAVRGGNRAAVMVTVVE